MNGPDVKRPAMNRIEVAVRARQWEVVWLYVLLGFTEAASRLPAEALDELLDVLGADEPGRKRGEGRRDGRSH